MKNECLKRRPIENPYEVWESFDGGMRWLVLKKWQSDDDKPYARWFCAVKSGWTYGGYDMGDVYVAEIKANARRIDDKFRVLAHAIGESNWSGNGMVYDTFAEAKAAALDLMSRWFGADDFKVVSAAVEVPLPYSGPPARHPNEPRFWIDLQTREEDAR